ncbi:hypothetical protein [Kaistia soli]|nr:hypothetical protein [Kaistia soli]
MAAGLFIAFGTGTALADQASADACAGSLNTEAKAIYAAAIGSVGSTDLKSLLTEKTKGLVMAGTVSRSTAKESAMAAANCLEMAQ